MSSEVLPDICRRLFNYFYDKSKVDKFIAYLNCRNPKIKFTNEVEENGCLCFLDVHVKRVGTQLSTSLYRKPSFTGPGLNFFTFIPHPIKNAVVQSAIFRAFRLCSDFKLFDSEIKFLGYFFQSNGFPTKMFSFSLRTYRNRLGKYLVLVKYLVLPYFGAQSHDLQRTW